MTTGLQINIDDSGMREAVQSAIFSSLNQEKRDELVKGAIQTLLTPPPKTSGYGSKELKSPLMELFDFAARETARKIVTEQLANDPAFIANIRELVTDAWTKLLVPGPTRERIVDKIADAIGHGLSERSY